MVDKFRGVIAHKDGGWIVQLGRDYLGYFKTHEDAVERRLRGEVEKHGQVFDRRGIEMCGDTVRIPLHGRHGKFYGYAVIDVTDLDLVKNIAWTLDLRGYAVGTPAGRGNNIPLHRLLVYGLHEKGGATDHVNGDKMDNRRKNLRKCITKENARNTKLAKNNTTGFKGVNQTPEGRWKAKIMAERKSIHIGHYDTKEEAAAAYNAAALILHGEFASPNAIAPTASTE